MGKRRRKTEIYELAEWREKGVAASLGAGARTGKEKKVPSPRKALGSSSPTRSPKPPWKKPRHWD